MGSFFHRHRAPRPTSCSRRESSARDLLPDPARVSGLPVPPVGAVPGLRVHVGVLELLRRHPRLQRAASFARSYAGIATLACLVLAYPLVYWIAFRAGPWKNLFLLFIIAPFFVTYLVRTLAWLNILADEGPVVGALRAVHLLDSDGRCSRPRSRSSRASHTTSSPSWRCRCTSPRADRSRGPSAATGPSTRARRRRSSARRSRSAPGIVAGTLLTFIPAAGDFINAALLGTPNQAMIGNVIQAKFLESLDYPGAASLSFVLMALILVALLVYAGSSAPRGSPMTERRRHTEPFQPSPRRRVGLGEAPRAHRLRAAGGRLPDAADRGRDSLLVQRAGGSLQLRLGGVHRQLGELDAVLGIEDAIFTSLRWDCSPRRRDRARHAHRPRDRAAPSSSAAAPRTCWSSCRSTPEIVLGASLLTLFLNTDAVSSSGSGRSSSPT